MVHVTIRQNDIKLLTFHITSKNMVGRKHRSILERAIADSMLEKTTCLYFLLRRKILEISISRSFDYSVNESGIFSYNNQLTLPLQFLFYLFTRLSILFFVSSIK